MFGAALQAVPPDFPWGDMLPLPPVGAPQQRIWEALDQALSWSGDSAGTEQ